MTPKAPRFAKVVCQMCVAAAAHSEFQREQKANKNVLQRRYRNDIFISLQPLKTFILLIFRLFPYILDVSVMMLLTAQHYTSRLHLYNKLNMCNCLKICGNGIFVTPHQHRAWTGIAQSVYRLATGWTVQESNPGGGRGFSDRPWAHPAFYTMGVGSFPGVKRPGRGVDHSPHVALRLKKQYSYTCTPPLGLSGLL
jgi:hypothetical protein